MFHWTERRILGHISLCYISFTLLNYLQLQLQKQGTSQSENQIRKSLVKMQMSLICQDQRQFYMRSKTSLNAKQILKTLSIRETPDIIPSENIKQYM